jgi:hypothetical protein
MSSNLIVLIYFLSFTKIRSCRNCLHITHMYNEAKVNTVIIFARKNGAAVLENAGRQSLMPYLNSCDGPQEDTDENDGKCGTSEKG